MTACEKLKLELTGALGLARGGGGGHPKFWGSQTGNSTREWRKHGWSTATYNNMNGPRNRMLVSEGKQVQGDYLGCSKPSNTELLFRYTHTRTVCVCVYVCILNQYSKAFFLISQGKRMLNTKIRRLRRIVIREEATRGRRKLIFI